MPKMMPPDFEPEWSPVSEEIVFRAAQDYLPDDWYVLHSFHFTSDDPQGKKKDGEIDFLFYQPDKGIVVMEVKGGAISYHDNQWYQDDRPIEPVKQTIRNKYFIVNLLSKALNRHVSLSVAHSVCFPGCHGKKDWPAELSGFVLTGDTLPQIETFLKDVLYKTPFKPTAENPAPSEQEVLHVLSPYLDFGNTLSERIANEKKRFFRLTDRQCAALDILENFDNMLIRGCAGSGKTIMAVKLAQRLAVQGKSVLLLCYNQLLASRLQAEVKEYPGITAAAFFEYCIETLKVPEEQVEKYRFNPRLVLLEEVRNRISGIATFAFNKETSATRISFQYNRNETSYAVVLVELWGEKLNDSPLFAKDEKIGNWTVSESTSHRFNFLLPVTADISRQANQIEFEIPLV